MRTTALISKMLELQRQVVVLKTPPKTACDFLSCAKKCDFVSCTKKESVFAKVTQGMTVVQFFTGAYFSSVVLDAAPFLGVRADPYLKAVDALQTADWYPSA